jgi:hypothetical protein
MHPDRPERPREDVNSPYSRPRDDRFDRRRDERDRDWGYDRARGWARERSPPRKSSSPEQLQGRDDRRRRSRSPAPRSDRDREKRPSPRHDGGARSLTRTRRTSPSPPPVDNRNYGRQYPSRPRQSSHYDQSQNGPSQSYRYRPSDSPQHRTTESSVRTMPGVSSTMSLNRGPQNFDTINAIAGKVPTEPSLSESSSTAVPSGPASWRRAQQYKQERPYHQDYRPNPSLGRGAAPLNPAHRIPLRPSFSSNPHSPAPLPHESLTATSPSSHRSIPTGPRALGRPNDPPSKKEYSSPVPELDEKVSSY